MTWNQSGIRVNRDGNAAGNAGAGQMDVPVQGERRRSRRKRVLYRGRIAFNSTTLNCMVKDLNEFGCRLKFAVPPVLPETFDLLLNKTGERIRCRLIWLSDREVGVSFILDEE